MNEKELITKLFSKPKTILIVANTNEGKSMMLYHLYSLLKKYTNFELVSYGLKKDLGEQKIYSTEQFENQHKKIIFVDEILNLFDLDDRKNKKQVEKSLRLIHHNNNVLVLAGLPENMKKFLGGKADMIIYKKCTFSDMINGSRVKRVCIDYKGPESGSSVLNIDKDKAILWDGKDYHKLDIPYYEEFDTKKDNKSLIFFKNLTENVPENVPKNVEKVFIKKVHKKSEISINPLNIPAKTIPEELKNQNIYKEEKLDSEVKVL